MACSFGKTVQLTRGYDYSNEDASFFFFLIIFFICFWLCRAFVARQAFSLVAESRDSSLDAMCRSLVVLAFLLAEHGV